MTFLQVLEKVQLSVQAQPQLLGIKNMEMYKQ